MKTEKAQHTPGPWRLTTDAQNNLLIKGKDCSLPLAKITTTPFPADYNICEKVHQVDHYIKIGEVNAALIAAAPELLAACKAFFDPTITDAHARIIVDEAIAKAEGRRR